MSRCSYPLSAIKSIGVVNNEKRKRLVQHKKNVILTILPDRMTFFYYNIRIYKFRLREMSSSRRHRLEVTSQSVQKVKVQPFDRLVLCLSPIGGRLPLFLSNLKISHHRPSRQQLRRQDAPSIFPIIINSQQR